MHAHAAHLHDVCSSPAAASGFSCGSHAQRPSVGWLCHSPARAAPAPSALPPSRSHLAGSRRKESSALDGQPKSLLASGRHTPPPMKRPHREVAGSPTMGSLNADVADDDGVDAKVNRRRPARPRPRTRLVLSLVRGCGVLCERTVIQGPNTGKLAGTFRSG